MRPRYALASIVAVSFLSVNVFDALAQIRPGSVGLGITLGASKYYGEFTDDLFGVAGEGALTYTPWKYLTVGAGLSLSELQWRITPEKLSRYPAYFGPGATIGDRYPGTLSTIERRSATRATTYEVTLAFNILPDERVVPSVGVGAGLMTWSPTNATEHSALPNNAMQRYERLVGVIPVFAGVQWFLSEDISLTGKGVYRFPFTPYLDDMTVVGGPYDSYATISAGITFHLLGDRDPDKDGLDNADEERYGTNPRSADSDNDALSDFEEVRVHGSNPLMIDTDGDNLTDFEEVRYHDSSPIKRDTDGDGVTDDLEIANSGNPRMPDTDGDGLSDYDELYVHRTKLNVRDSDDDGLDDGDEVRLHGTNPLKPDTDGDGLVDGEEVVDHRTNPLVADTDNDGLSDGAEVLIYRTNPTMADTDNDRLLDGEEVIRYKTSPLFADTDRDGLSDADELSCRYQTNPLLPDTDHDGVIDSKDKTPSEKCAGCGGGGIPPYESGSEPPPAPSVPAEPATPPTMTPPPATKPAKKFSKDIRFKLNSDEFDFDQPETTRNLQELLSYLQESCDDLQVMVEGHASSEGPADRNRELSDLRARRVQAWLIEQGVPPSKIRGAVGYGSSLPRVKEPSPAAARRMNREQLESIRRLNRRIEIAVMRDCPIDNKG